MCGRGWWGGGSVPQWDRVGTGQSILKKGSLGKPYAGHYSIQPRGPQSKDVLGSIDSRLLFLNMKELGSGQRGELLEALYDRSGKTLAPFNTRLYYHMEGPFPNMLSRLRYEEPGNMAQLVECLPSIHRALSLNPSIA